ncbi:DUF523 domain-containing protein [uncultured Clostridium sp.]|jgi:uncharacterized protein YbbK (DUF523 family)|uniref:DUF523 domain-containing protein n=1 Tax=uncultured Clostridium sp. TaxID=59620 RepID=UPI002608D120|nr:DUF523 domain-containing protein [uncultured Clostridium sp.]
MILVSACLCGENCKYSGGNNKNKKVLDFIKDKEVVCICPEELGGLSTPRNPAEIIGSAKGVLDNKDKIITNDDKDVTLEFLRGAVESLKIAKENKVELAILKAKSPSCGKGMVYDGTFSNIKIKGNGVTAQLFIDNNIKVLTEDDV